MQVDDEHLSLTDQKDQVSREGPLGTHRFLGAPKEPPLIPGGPLLTPQLSLRLKAMKRQVAEAEEEIDRLENTKKKLQRDLEDQVELNDQLQGQLTTIRQDLR